MQAPKWWQVLRGGHAYGEGPEQETSWIRDSFCMGIMLGVFVTSFLFLVF